MLSPQSRYQETLQDLKLMKCVFQGSSVILAPGLTGWMMDKTPVLDGQKISGS